MAGGKGVRFTFAVDASSYSSGVAKVISINKKMAQSAKEAGHANVSSMQAASGAIRLLENPLGNNIRAIERLSGMIPGLGKALQSAFPIVGGIAFASMIAENTEKVLAFIKAQREAPNAIKDGFGTLLVEARSSNDALRLTNDTLDNQILKLQGKPQNNLKIALDEARLAADDLAKSLDTDFDKITKLIAEDKVSTTAGLFGAFFGGNATTTGVDNNIKNFLSQIRGRGRDLQDASDAGDQAGVEAAKQEIARLRTNYKSYLNTTLTQFRSGQMNEAGDPAANINTLTGAQRAESAAEGRDSLQEQNRQKDAALKKQEAAVALARRQHEAAQRAAETQKKQIESSFTAKEMAGGLTQAQVTAYWNDILSANANGQVKLLGDNKEFVQQKMVESSTEFIRTWREQSKRIAAEVKKANEELIDHQLELPHIGEELSRAIAEQQKKQGEDQTKAFGIGADQTEIQQANAQAMRQANLSVAESTQTISAHAAAGAEARIHQDEFSASLERLQAIGKDLASRPDAMSDAVQDLIRTNANEQDRLTGAHNAQQIGDQAAIAATTIGGRWSATLNTMTSQFTDFAGQLQSIFTSTIGNLNDTIAHVLTTRHMNGHETRQAFADMARNSAGSVVKSGLQGIEGTALKGLGFGTDKLGSQSNPMWVRMSQAGSAISGAASGLFGKIASMFGGGSQNPMNLQSGGSIGLGALESPSVSAGVTSGLGSIAPMILPMLAGGGPLDGNSPAIIGEKGPELWIPKSAGTVIPNHAMNSYMGNGDLHIHHNIDARGSSNPAETKRMIAQALNDAAPHIISASVKAGHNYNRNRPSIAHK